MLNNKLQKGILYAIKLRLIKASCGAIKKEFGAFISQKLSRKLAINLS